MACRAYTSKNFHRSTLVTIKQCVEVAEEYQAQGYALTLRQLYYQLVARDLIPNEQKAYNRLGNIVSDARMAGYIDWEAIEDRTRSLEGNSHWADPAHVVENVAGAYRIDCWADQPRRCEVWVEKEALAGVVARTCRRLDIDYFSCRGYPSQSSLWKAAQRLLGYAEGGQPVVIFHLGDHDPSGIDMTRDIRERLHTFIGQDYMHAQGTQTITAAQLEEMLRVERIALNMQQVERYDPPPNPAKRSDSRFRSYAKRFGPTSWELDALEPRVLDALIERHVTGLRDEALWKGRQEQQKEERALLSALSDNIEEVQAFLES